MFSYDDGVALEIVWEMYMQEVKKNIDISAKLVAAEVTVNELQSTIRELSSRLPSMLDEDAPYMVGHPQSPPPENDE